MGGMGRYWDTRRGIWRWSGDNGGGRRGTRLKDRDFL